jgi:hypothetical protein
MKNNQIVIIQKNIRLLGILLLMLYWIVVVFPFFSPSFIPTHDGEFHIIRIYEFSKMLKDGYIVPRWAPDLNSQYGMPLFIFHYPFPNYVGSIFYLIGFSLISSFKMTLISGYLLAIITCYIFLLKYSSAYKALASTIIFSTVPYWFVDISIRGSVGEIWGIAWSMASLASIVWNKKIFLGLSIFFLCISHNIMTMLAVPILGIFLIIHNRYLLAYFFLGIIASSYFWIPALFESRYMIGLNTSTFSDHFPQLFQLIIPSWGSGFSAPGSNASEMSQQIGIIPLIVYLIASVLFFRKKSLNNTIEPKYFSIVFLIAVLLMLEMSLPIWSFIKPLQYVQYPWRLLSLIIIALPLITIFVFNQVNKWIIVSMVLMSILLTYNYTKPVLYEPRNDEYYTLNKTFTDGTSSMGNSFTTIWTDWKKDRPNSRISVIKGKPTIISLTSTSIMDSFMINGNDNSTIAINRLYYPGWQVYVDGKKTPIDYSNGIVEVAIPSGSHTVKAVFEDTTLRILSNIISLFSISTIIILGLINKSTWYKGMTKYI